MSVNRTTIAIVIPARNEQEIIATTLSLIPSGYTIIVVDNGSTDQTAVIARRMDAITVCESRPGYGRAVLTGLLEAHKMNASIAVILDADGSDDPQLINTLIQPLIDGNADFTIGQRSKYAEPGSLTSSQRFGNWLSVKLIYYLTGHQYSDMGPFRAITMKSLRTLQLQDPTYGWNIEMQIKAVREGLRIQEFEFPYKKRQGGSSKISGDLQASIKAGCKIIYTAFRYAR